MTRIITDLSDADIRAKAPAVFATAPHKNLSERYSFIPTFDVLNALRAEGFVVTQASQDRALHGSDPRLARHVLKLQQRDAQPIVGEGVMQFLLSNSHNGSSALQVRGGFYRFVCSNGMVVGTDMMGARERHAGDAAREAIDRVKQLARHTDVLTRLIEGWKSKELTERKEREFAARALVLRFGEDRAKQYEPSALLGARRAEDEGRSVWAVLNRIQENAMRGGQEGRSATGRAVRSRELKGIAQDLEFNGSLWKLAEEVAA